MAFSETKEVRTMEHEPKKKPSPYNVTILPEKTDEVKRKLKSIKRNTGQSLAYIVTKAILAIK